ncbi:gluconate:H+ symporter [Chitinophagaceae bacterium LWZ2-11]
MTFFIIFLCIALLIVLITWCKLNTFLSFLLVSVAAGLLLGIPLNKVTASVQQGIGDTLSSLTIIIVFGAMLGKLVAESGAANKIASTLMRIFGPKYIQWALVATGFIIGIPLFYGIGFVLMVPLIFSVVYKYKLPAVYIGLPMLAALSVTHGFLPPHPSPTALVNQFHANMGITLLYGLIVAIPAIIIAGPVFSTTLKNIVSEPSSLFRQEEEDAKKKLPGTSNSFFTALLPVFLLIITTVANYFLKDDHSSLKHFIAFIGDAPIVMILSILTATFTLGLWQGRSMQNVMNIYGDAVKDIAMILLIIAGAGALKQVMADSGVSAQLAEGLQTLHINPLVLGWLIAAVIRGCVGSATIAGLTTAGIIMPLMIATHTNPNLMVLAVGSGSLMLSHVNDAGFWLFKEYFNLSIKDTIRSWSVMETIVGVVGLIGVMLLNIIIG